jgi:phosphomannomutase
MASHAPLIVGISGIRGIVGDSLTTEIVARFARAFGTWMHPQSTVLVARDTRPSGHEFSAVCRAGLQQTGCDVVDLGVCSTPTAKMMVGQLQAQGALIVTASHNPGQWNGLKMVRGDGVFLNAAEGAEVERIFNSQDFRDAAGAESSFYPQPECNRTHIERILDQVDVERIRAAKLSVAIDYCNGVGSILIPDLLKELGVGADAINAEPNGQFARDPEPLPENLGDLGGAVGEGAAVAGFAVDPDGDRVALVDEHGKPVGEDYTLALAVQTVASQKPGPVVTTLSTSQTVSDVAQSHGCSVALTAVGEVHVTESMLALEAVIGGEGNGGVIITDVVPGRDAALGIALTLEALSRAATGLSTLIGALPRYYLDKRKLSCTTQAMEHAIARLRQTHANAFEHPVQDGTKLYLSGELSCPWIHLRASNTEPVVRVCAESADVAEASALCDQVEAFLSAVA